MINNCRKTYIKLSTKCVSSKWVCIISASNGHWFNVLFRQSLKQGIYSLVVECISRICLLRLED